MLKAIKNQEIFSKWGRLLLLSILLFVLFYQMNQFDWSNAKKVRIQSVHYLLIAWLLVGLNWYFEWRKWTVGMRSITDFSDSILFKGFYAGMLAGFLTPSALGNFLGRITAFHPEWRSKVTATTLVGNGAQFWVSLFFGVLSLFLVQDFPFVFQSNWMRILLISLVLIVGLLYFTIGNSGFLKKLIAKRVSSLAAVSFSIRLQFLFLSIFRYLTFSLQFFLVIKTFQPEIKLEILFWVWQLYLWTTLSPSLFLGKLFIRETFAVFILAQAGVELPVALLSSILIWLMNNALPSVFAYFKWKQNDLVEA
ncbi:MAG: hypothetical protein WC044_05605 [Crocinitomicaceae bacterium]